MKIRCLMMLLLTVSFHPILQAAALSSAKEVKPIISPATSPVLAVSKPEPTQERMQEVLDFWFGALSDPTVYPDTKTSLWTEENFNAGQLTGGQFEGDVRKALLGQLNEWRQTPKGRLALILLLDQFTRRMYFGKPQAFAGEAMAKGLVLEGIQNGDDKKLLPIQRAFFYMPLQRSEDLGIQNLSVEQYTRLFQEAPRSIKPRLKVFLDGALAKRQIIVRFKRFPNRNQILGRESTIEETLFLNQKGIFKELNTERN